MRLTTRLVSSLFLAFLVFGEFHSTAKAQYSVSTSVGSDFMFFPPPAFQFVTKTLIIGGTQADTMSAWQSLPFPWKLFGTTVTGFRASDNGYVTFTNNSDPNVPNPIAIPSSAAPNMAIYAFWHDWDLATNMGGPMGVFTFTYGTAPQRTFYIEWAGATSTVLHEPYSFAIALKECGDFEVIVMRGHTNSTVTGIVGVEDGNGLRATMVAGSPALPFPISANFNQGDDIVYTFTDTTRHRDLRLLSINTDADVWDYQDTISFSVRNKGSVAVTSMKIGYSIDGGQAVLGTLSTNLAADSTLSTNHPVLWNIVPNYNRDRTIKVWIAEVNGGPNQSICGADSLTKIVRHKMSITVPKFVLVEDHSGSWCGVCPAQHNIVWSLGNPAYIRVEQHHGDPMDINSPLVVLRNGVPSTSIDRRIWPFYGLAVNGTQTATYMQAASRDTGRASIDVYGQFDAQTRTLTGNLFADFVNYVDSGEIRMSLLIVEDSVTGYPQANNGGTPNPDPNWVHRFVLRDHPTGAWGAPGVIPQLPLPGTQYSTPVSYTVPPAFNIDQVYLIPVLSYYNADSSKRRVINTRRIPIKNVLAVGQEEQTDVSTWKVYPNPTEGIVRIDGLEAGKKIRATLLDITGRAISPEYAGLAGNFELDLSELNAGIYFLKLQCGGHSKSFKVLKH